MLTQALDAATQKTKPKVGDSDSDTIPNKLNAMGTFLGSINEVQNNSSESDSKTYDWRVGQDKSDTYNISSGVKCSHDSNSNDIDVSYASIDQCLDAAVTEEALSIAQLVHGHPKPKKARIDELQPIVLACLNIRQGKTKVKMLKCLLYTGASGSLIAQNILSF